MINQYSVDFKLKIVKMVLNENISKKEILRTYNVATKTQRQWIHKLLKWLK
jgi:transposase